MNNPPMTLRDYFAGRVINGIHYKGKFIDSIIPEMVEYSYKVADAMLKEKAKKEDNHGIQNLQSIQRPQKNNR